MRFETINLGVAGPPGPASTVPGPQGIQGPQGIAGPPGGEAGSVNGVLSLRALAPVSGQTLHLNYHTTPGDLGAGEFYGVTTGGPYTDNDGTIIVPTGGDGSAAWLRVWDGVTAYVGWFGARCTPRDISHDDYAAVQKCFDLFTDGRKAAGTDGVDAQDAKYTGTIDVGPGFCFSQPLIYGGSNGSAFKLVGQHGNARGGHEVSLLNYTGPETHAAIIFYGANEWSIEDFNTFPGLALTMILVTADNTYNNFYVHTTSAAITAGANRVVTPLGGPAAADRVLWLQPGTFLGVDDGGPNFEIIQITAVDTTAGTFTADFAKNHAGGVLLGGGAVCSSGWVNRCRLLCAPSPIWTRLTADVAGGGGSVTFHVVDVTGIKVGHPLRVGSLLFAEIVYPTSVNAGAGTFTAVANFNHSTNALVMYPTAAIAVGNRLVGTVQCDNIAFQDTFFIGASLTNYPGTGEQTSSCYAGFRQISGGNTKAFFFTSVFPLYLRVGFACESSSGQYIFNGGSSAILYEVIWHNIASTLMVHGWEDESTAMWLTATTGTSPSQATFIGCTMQGTAPTPSYIVEASDEMFIFGGNLTFIGCYLRNDRVHLTTLPIIVATGVSEDIGVFPGGLAIINSVVYGATLANFDTLVRRSSGDATNILQSGPGNVTMLNCIGNTDGANVRLPNIIPPLKMWQGISGSITPSLAANTAGAIQTLAVSGAALGDLVDVSFSQTLGEMLLRAWVSAADVVSYQFRNPTASLITLTAGTVKCRVNK